MQSAIVRKNENEEEKQHIPDSPAYPQSTAIQTKTILPVRFKWTSVYDGYLLVITIRDMQSAKCTTEENLVVTLTVH
ncbi:hypothetical protein KIN20_004071 [Parelaphostrongylus tenuis]|uniref:Uncharacterized protein n=1 Tax=Parelaphostrongylus tenuis TaxID=148309 RepID=A0AAD5LXU8_PARTN|nr:hypothetical protein KIN20_004071 [Parelaphostrongylus tenuis]